MKSPWSFPTSPRSPYKVIKRLKLIKILDGMDYNIELQKRVGEIIRNESNQKVGLSSKHSSLDFVGRDYLTRAPKKLGVIYLPKSGKGKFIFTEQGNNLIKFKNMNFILQRQIAKIQYPSPISSKGTENIKIIPLTTTLYILENVKSLSRFETSIFVITIENYNNIKKSIKEILSFRKKLASIKGNLNRRKFRLDAGLNKLKEFYKNEDIKLREKKGKKIDEKTFLKTKLKNHRDYADAIVRYFIATGLFKLNKNSRLEISQINKLDSDYILKNIGLKPKDIKLNNEKYVKNYLGLEKTTNLYTDNLNNLENKFNYIEKISSKLKLKIDFLKEKQIFNKEKSIDLKKDIIIELQDKINLEKMKDFIKKLSLRNKSDYEDIVKLFGKIIDRNSDILDRPLLYEYNFFRAFSFIGFAKNIIPSMNFDEDTNPLNTTSNKPDLIVEYDKFILVVEVTLTSGQRQYESEGAPVFRHVGKCQKDSKKPVFGIFIAEKMDENISIEFLSRAIVKTHIYNGRVRILPMTRDEFIILFKKIYNEKLNDSFLFKLLNELLNDNALLKYQNFGEKKWIEDLNKKIQPQQK